MVVGVVGVFVVTLVTRGGVRRVRGEAVETKNSNPNNFNKKYKIYTYHGKDSKN